MLAGEIYPIYERIFHHKDGRQIPVEINAALVRDSEGTPIHIQSIIRDVSARKRSDRLLTKLNEASLEIQKALTVGDIFEAAGDKLKEIGMRCAVFLIDESQDAIFPVYFNIEANLIEIAEKLEISMYRVKKVINERSQNGNKNRNRKRRKKKNGN